MQHASRFVPHECCTARACDEASARHVNVFLCGHFTGWVGGSLSGSRSALLFGLGHGHVTFALVRAWRGVTGGRVEPMMRLPERVPAVSPREFSGTAALMRGIRGPRRKTNTGHGAGTFPRHDHHLCSHSDA